MIDDKGERVGVIPVEEALEMASDKNLDLVEVASPTGKHMVCKLLDYGRYSYHEKKRRNEARTKQRQATTKMIKFRPNTFEGDYKVKLQKIRRFLSAGDKVKVVMQFKGREIIHSQHGFLLFNKLAEELSDAGTVDAKPAAENRYIQMVLAPIPGSKRGKALGTVNGE